MLHKNFIFFFLTLWLTPLQASLVETLGNGLKNSSKLEVFGLSIVPLLSTIIGMTWHYLDTDYEPETKEYLENQKLEVKSIREKISNMIDGELELKKEYENFDTLYNFYHKIKVDCLDSKIILSLFDISVFEKNFTNRKNLKEKEKEIYKEQILDHIFKSYNSIFALTDDTLNHLEERIKKTQNPPKFISLNRLKNLYIKNNSTALILVWTSTILGIVFPFLYILKKSHQKR